MIASVLQRSLLVGLLWCVVVGALAAQIATGRVVGIDGGPGVGATVSLFDRDGAMLGEVLVDRRGRFEFTGERPIATIVVQSEAVWVERLVAAGQHAHHNFDLSNERHWTMRGHVVDPEGAVVGGVDLLMRRADNQTLGCVTTGASGDFLLRSNQPVAELIVAPLGWHHVVTGPFDSNRGLAIDLRLHRSDYRLFHGVVLDLQGSPVPRARVVAKTKKAKTSELIVCANTVCKADGTFRLWSKEETVELSAVRGLDQWVCPGNWVGRADQKVVLDAARDGIVQVRGTLLDADGKPITHAVIYASNQQKLAGRSRGLSATNVDGHFVAAIRRATPFLIATSRRGKVKAFATGPWSGEPLKLRAK